MPLLPGPDPRLDPFILVTEVAHGRLLAEPIFQRKYRKAAPDVGHHILVLYQSEPGVWLPASYTNYRHFDDAMLIGGSCTDGRVLRAMTPEQQALVNDAGGLMLQTVRYGENYFAHRSVGTFGYCGDERSWSILKQCGYQRLDHPHLIVRWNREPEPGWRAELLSKIDAFGPF